MGIVAGVGVCGVATGVRHYADIEWGLITIAPILAISAAAAAHVIYSGIGLEFGGAVRNMIVRVSCIGGVYCVVVWGLERQRLVLYLTQLRKAVS